MWLNIDDLIKTARNEPWAVRLPEDKAFWRELADWIEQHALPEFLEKVTRRVDEIVEISPDYSERRILQRATRHMVDFLDAHHASIRIYDPHSEQMLSYGSYPFEEGKRAVFIPLHGSIAGEVVRSRETVVVPDLLSDPRYKDKQTARTKGVNSLMAIPLEIPRFYPRERRTVGVIQIYFTEKKRHFNSLEIQIANLMARRLSFVIARKKILSMHWNNEKKETIVRHIFHTLGSRGGVKLKDVYNRVIPEIADMVSLQSSALFSVASDLETVVLEAGYPEEGGYHSIGKRFPLKSEPSFELLLNLRHYAGDSVSEIVTPSYVLVVDPENSAWISAHMKQFASRYNINSILYIPLEVDGEVRHIITFDTLDQRQRYSDDEIDILLFVGRELMKAQRMERLDDALHDFKNPAIATAGFARRLKALLEREDRENSEEQIWKYVDILLQETSRLQELALSLYEVGKEQVLNLTEILQKRFDINKEAIREQLKQNVDLEEGPFDADLQILGYRLHLERIFDNLLNNATNAIPLKGGRLGIRTYADGEWACAEITNSGHISEEDRLKILEGEGEGRGLYITHRIIGMLKGKIEVEGGKETTTFIVRLPRHQPADGGSRQA